MKAKSKKSKGMVWSVRSVAIIAFAIVAIAVSFSSLISSTIVAQAASFSYTVSIADADFSGNTLTVSAPVDVVKFVGTESSQWVKITWGDGAVEVLQAMAQTNYVKSPDGKDFSIHNLVRSHTYSTEGAFSVTVKVYHGNESGNEGSADQSNTVTFQTENTLILCSDSLDNDHDTFIDLLDPDCAQFLNHAPVANDDTYNTNEDTAISPVAPGVISNDTDYESSSLTATLVGDVSNGTLTFNTDGSFSYTPNTNWNGTDSFTYTVSDGALTSNTATVYIVVSNTNDAPVAADDTYAATEDMLLNVNAASGVLANDTDADGDTLTAVLESDVNDGTLTLNADGSFTYMPDANWSGMDSFTYKAYDGSFYSSAKTVVINVAAVQDAPTANALSVSTDQNVAVSDTLTGADVDGDTLTFATTSSPLHGTISGFNAATGAFTYTPDTNYLGSDSFSFTTTDGSETSAPATVTITVNAVAENTASFCADGIDNDGDTLIDLNDSDCAAFVPVVTPPSTGGGGSGSGSGGNGGGGGGGVVGSGPLSIGFVNTNGGGGFVLGTSTEILPPGCSVYLGSYLRMGSKNNNPEEVKKLQSFLNQYIAAGLPVTGVFGPMTFKAVENFQVQNWEKVLKPWVAYGLPTDHTPTGYVYKTTKHTINLLNCSTLNIPEPQLP